MKSHRFIWIISVTLFSVVAGCVSPNSKNFDVATTITDRRPAVFNGVVAMEGDEVAKSVVAITTEDPPYFRVCSGTLIAQDLVLTAAHCLVDEKGKRYAGPTRVFFGLAFNLSKSAEREQGEIVQPKDISVLRKYNTRRRIGFEDNDLALLRLSKPAPANVGPAAVMTTEDPAFRNLEYVVAGFSVFNSEFEKASGIPYKLRYMQTAFQTDAMDSPGYSSNTAKLIAIQTDRAHAFGHGDSGGPCFSRTSTGLKLWGVIHGGYPGDTQWCTPIFRYTQWLAKTVKELRSALPD